MNSKTFSSLFSLVSVIGLFALQACTPREITTQLTAQVLKAGAPALEEDQDVLASEASGLTMIKMVESFLYSSPNNKTLNILLARSYANYAQGFLEWNMLKYEGVDEKQFKINEERAIRFYERGKDLGLKVLNRKSSFKNALNSDLDSFKKSLGSFGRKDVPLLFWTAMNWGSLINLKKDSPIAIAQFPKVEAIMQRVMTLDENYFYGGPNLFFGYSYGSRPPMFGGDPTKSKQHFEKAIKAYGGKFLLGKVYYAQSYAIQNQDPNLYTQVLNEVLSADAAALPEQRLANELAKLRAQWLLDNQAKFFGGNDETKLGQN